MPSSYQTGTETAIVMNLPKGEQGGEGGGGRVVGRPGRGGRGRQREAGHRRGELRHAGEDDLRQEEGMRDRGFLL